MLDVFFDKWWRLGGVCGILFVILLIAGIAIQGSYPEFTDPVDEVRDWYTDNGEQFLIGGYVVGLAFVLLFLPFLSSLRSLLAAAEGGAAVWSRVAFAAGLLVLVLGAVASVFSGTLAYALDVAKGGELDDGSIRLMQYMEYASQASVALVPFLLASSLVIVRTGVLWRWLAIPGVVGAALGALAGLAVTESEPYEGVAGGIGGIAYPLTALWILLVSINMVLKKEAPTAT